MPASNGAATALSAASPTGALGREALKGELNGSGCLWGVRRPKAGATAWKCCAGAQEGRMGISGEQEVMHIDIFSTLSVGDHTDCSQEPGLHQNLLCFQAEKPEDLSLHRFLYTNFFTTGNLNKNKIKALFLEEKEKNLLRKEAQTH